MLPKLYIRFRSNYWLHLFSLNLRNLLGMGFLIGGLRKIDGQPFANPGQPGAFFEFLDAMHANLIYYEFIGWAQVIAAVLLMTQRFSTLGAVIYFPIILNISIFTVFSVGTLTPWIASFMCLGALFLLLWDYPKWINIFSKDNQPFSISQNLNFPTYSKLWVINGIVTSILPTIVLLMLSLSDKASQLNLHKTVFLSSILITVLINIIVNVADIYRNRNV